MEVKQLTEKLYEQNMFSEKEKPIAEFLLTWMNQGRKKAEEFPDSKKWIKNLEAGGFIEDNKLVLSYDSDEEISLAFLLVMLGARGVITQSKGANTRSD